MLDARQRARLSLAGLSVGDALGHTVPSALWCVAGHHDDFRAAFWATVSGLGDRDTTCAICGGVALSCGGVPEEWVASREGLPEGFERG